MTTTDQKTPRFYLAMLASKAAVGALDLTHHRGGQVPGVVAEKIDPDFLSHIDKPDHVVFVSGTNGKTTTTNLLSDLLVDNGHLFIGHSESLFNVSDRFRLIGKTIYRKAR